MAADPSVGKYHLDQDVSRGTMVSRRLPGGPSSATTAVDAGAMKACKCDRRGEWRVRDRRWIVDVDDVDWSSHPAWGSDFSASEMQVSSLEELPEWSDGVEAVELVYVCDVCGSRRVVREPVNG